jgi:hypothetical protein
VRSAARTNSAAACKAIARFAKTHPIAAPRLHLCRAIAARLEGREEEATRHLRDGLTKARSFDMQFERQKLERECERQP